ncbi:MAG TPA: hypothetical protein VK716_15495 [Terracidiphilus sp.]|nr:hypothetical protein [Terracidiphilus sp.]
MSPRLVVAAIALVASSACAQQAPSGAAKGGPASAHSQITEPRLAAMAGEIRGSYYHPDDLMSIDCAVNADWPAFLASSKLAVDPERIKTLEGLKIRSRAIRGQDAAVTFDWSTGPFNTHDQIEGGLKQVLGGFYKMYWSMLASSMISKSDKLANLETLQDGESKATIDSDDMKLVITMDKTGAPTRYEFDSQVMKGTIEAGYLPSPNPVPGDLRRVSTVKVNEQIGASAVVAAFSLDYQQAGEFFVPKNVTFAVPGAYSIKLAFSDCSASRVAISQ